MTFVDAAPLSDLDEGVPLVVKVGVRELVLVRSGERVYAVRNVCPHQTQSFAGGVVHGRVERQDGPGRIAVNHDRPILTCPWHHWEFDLESGACPIDARRRIRAYATAIEGGRVLVDVSLPSTGPGEHTP